MTNKNNEQKLNDIRAKLEALRPENIIDEAKLKERAEAEKKILREIIEKDFENRNK